MTVMPMNVTNAYLAFQIDQPDLLESSFGARERPHVGTILRDPPEVAQLAHNILLNRIAISGGV